MIEQRLEPVEVQRVTSHVRINSIIYLNFNFYLRERKLGRNVIHDIWLLGPIKCNQMNKCFNHNNIIHSPNQHEESRFLS